ncbi:hypothetical protein Cgig2_007085 [Carnegiea gigantea]|uniref:Uncharacterized protein n=1 Tax=Carnegiea gigantea TaxID=171969 RepID=A0A9Q1JSL1_9CARY|nr:hypothetical protein Cgig2_007085 [Carnegiea gigantea]
MEVHHQVSQYVQILNFDNNGKLNKKTTSGNVINDPDLNDDERNHNKDCIFVKSEKKLMPRIPKSEKKVGKNIDSVSVQCADDYDDDNDEITIVTAKPPYFDCIKNYVASKLQDGVPQVNCPLPSCPGLLEPQYCKEILPFEFKCGWHDGIECAELQTKDIMLRNFLSRKSGKGVLNATSMQCRTQGRSYSGVTWGQATPL